MSWFFFFCLLNPFCPGNSEGLFGPCMSRPFSSSVSGGHLFPIANACEGYSSVGKKKGEGGGK